MTGREREQYALDVAVFGDRVAYWLHREAQGWSMIDELAYWADVREKCTSYKEEHYWIGGSAA